MAQNVSTPHQPQQSGLPKINNNNKVIKDKEKNYQDDSLCSSTKHHKKMHDIETNDNLSLTYTWDQTESDVTITVKLKGFEGDLKGAFDISFTGTEVHIVVANEQKHSIPLYSAIEKEKSRVQVSKESIILRVVKQQFALWPSLETQEDLQLAYDSPDNKSPKCYHDEINKLKVEASILNNGDTEGKDKEDEIIDKEEEPVFHLDHVKNDFFERDVILSLQIFVKCFDKDAVRIVFSKQGFILKFNTGDTKFLQLHEGTTSETTFSWPVVTRQEIVQEECKIKVKQSSIEVTLRKTSSVRWNSLEAPLRKDTLKTDSWVPLTRNNTQPPSALSSNSSEDDNRNENKKAVMFDDMEDIDIKKSKGMFKNTFTSTDSQSVNEDADNLTSMFGSNVKSRTNNSQEWNKPTAKVQPLSQGPEASAVISPGYAGLVNVGNTCFMNCVLQVLVNTREFRDYFLDDRFLLEINEDNPLGMKGHLATTFGLLLKRLWSCLKYCWEPRKLKDLISKKNPQFFGFAQHDAHEFLAFLLDGLHEDLNRIRKKPYIETTDSNGRPDEEVADEAWAQYKSRNDSCVVDLFQGQFKSKLVCPKCGKVSITFDPFLYMSVPLPKKKKVIPVTFMWKESYKKPVKYQLLVAQDSSVDRLIDDLAQRTSVHPHDIRVFEAYRGKILKFFISGASLNSVEAKDIIVACEVLSEAQAGEEVLEIPVMQRTLLPSEFPTRCAFCHKPCVEGTPLKRCTKCFKVGYCDHKCQRSHWSQHKTLCSTSLEPVGCPFILSVPASRATYTHLVQHMEEYARFSVDVFQPPFKAPEVPASVPIAPSNPPCSSPSPSTPVPPSNLLGSLSQSCSSLNSLDSLSSASSTCTITGEQSDTQAQGEGHGQGEGQAEVEDTVDPSDSDLGPPSSSSLTSGSHGDNDSVRSASVDSGFESLHSQGSDKASVPTSQVMGVQASDADRERALPTFYIKPVSMEGVGLKGAERLEDKGDTPLELGNRGFLSMDWRNNERLAAYVLVQGKELEGSEVTHNNKEVSPSRPSLTQCLELFTEPEVLNPEEAWYCPQCKKHVEASKQMSIWRLPHTLIIQLKRFSFQNFLMRSKIKKLIDFPTRGLNLTQFCKGQKPGEAPPIYDLYGVANHHGLLIGGHYTSYVKCHNDAGSSGVGWRLCDDSRVSSVASERSVVTADAYLLFYRRRDVMGVIGGPSGPIGAAGSSSSQDIILSSGEAAPPPRDDLHGSAPREVTPASPLPAPHARPTPRGEAGEAQGDQEVPHVSSSSETGALSWNKDTTVQPVASSSLYGMPSNEIFNDDDDDNDSVVFEDNEDDNKLVIDTSPDLGYSDMEALD